MVLLLLIATRVDSPLCKICAETGTVSNKTLVPIKEEKKEGNSNDNDEKDQVSVSSIEITLKKNSTKDSSLIFMEPHGEEEDLDNMEDIKETCSMDQVSVISSDNQPVENMTPNQNFDSIMDQKDDIISERSDI